MYTGTGDCKYFIIQSWDWFLLFDVDDANFYHKSTASTELRHLNLNFIDSLFIP